jgi:putative membrane protein
MPHQLHMHNFADLWHPWVLAWVVLVQVGYLLLVGPWRQAFKWGPPVATRQKVLFSIAIWSVYLSEGTPLHVLAETYLFSAHMVQHVVLTMVLPPLLVLGTPVWVMQWVLRFKPFAFLFRYISKPLPALLIFNLIYSFWHLPGAYQATLWWHWFHMVQHAILVSTAILTWWPIVSPLPEYPELPPPAKMLFIFVSGVMQIAVFAFITFADSVMYQFYANAPRIWEWLTPLIDQQLAGVIMKVGGMGIYILTWGLVFFKWAAREEMAPAQSQPANR